MNVTTTETPALPTRAQLLSELRSRIRSSVGVDGIYLTYHSRYEGSLNDVVKIVKSLGGFIAEKGKAGKVRFREDHSTTPFAPP